MNVFILNAGRCGSMTFIAACRHITNYEANIRLFLKDKSQQMDFALEQAKTDFPRFWERIGAEGDLDRALREWEISYNASPM